MSERVQTESCAHCGAAYAPRTYAGRPKLYCSDYCRHAGLTPEQKQRRRFARYGLTVEDAEAMRLMQGGRCDICGDSLRVSEHVDHDHETGEVRALLCGPCNLGLGNFKDSPGRVSAAVAYLRRYQ